MVRARGTDAGRLVWLRAPQFRSRVHYIISMATTGYNCFKMAALNLEAPPSPLEQSMPGAVSTRRLEGTLVAPRVTKPVPNHLADTSKCKLSGYRYIRIMPESSVEGFMWGQLVLHTALMLHLL